MRSPPCLKARGTPRAGYFVHRRGRASAQCPFRPHVPVIFPCSLAARGNRLTALFPMIPGAARRNPFGQNASKPPSANHPGPEQPKHRKYSMRSGAFEGRPFLHSVVRRIHSGRISAILCRFSLQITRPLPAPFASDCPAKCFRGA